MSTYSSSSLPSVTLAAARWADAPLFDALARVAGALAFKPAVVPAVARSLPAPCCSLVLLVAESAAVLATPWALPVEPLEVVVLVLVLSPSPVPLSERLWPLSVACMAG